MGLADNSAHWRMIWLSHVFGEPPKNLYISLSFLDFLHSLEKILPVSCSDNICLITYIMWADREDWKSQYSTCKIFIYYPWFQQSTHLSSAFYCCGVRSWCLYFTLYRKADFRLLPCRTGTITQLYGEEDRILETNCLNRFLNQFSCF